MMLVFSFHNSCIHSIHYTHIYTDPWGYNFPDPSTPGLGPTEPPYKTRTESLSRGVKRPGRGVSHTPPLKADVKERVELYLYSSSGPKWPILWRTLPFCIHIHKFSQYSCYYVRQAKAFKVVQALQNFEGVLKHIATTCTSLTLRTLHFPRAVSLQASYYCQKTFFLTLYVS